MNQHSCIKCKEPYQDKDPDDYYCSPCLEEKKKLAQKIDAQIASRPKKKRTPSLLQAYDAAPKVRGFIHAKYLM